MEQLKVKFKKNHPHAVIPKYNIPGEDAGLDLTAVDYKFTPQFIEYDLGISVEIPKGYVGLIFPRSSVTKQDLILKNCVGVIDSGYRGNLIARFYKTQKTEAELYKVGDRVCQLILFPYPEILVEEVEELDKTSVRGEGGFGSSGK